MTKFEDILKPGGSYEILMSDGTNLTILGTAKAQVALEKADDAAQVLHLSTIVSSGRRKGERSKTAVPYHAITRVLIGG